MYLILKRRRILGLPEDDPEEEPEPEEEPDPEEEPELDPEEDPPVLVLGGAEVLELFPLLLELGGDEVVGGGATRAHLNEFDSLLMTSSVQL